MASDDPPIHPLPAKRKPRQWSILRLAGVCCILTTFVVTGLIIYSLSVMVVQGFKVVRDPHATHVHKPSFDADLASAVHDAGHTEIRMRKPVLPLIGHDTIFDVVLTVWRKKAYDSAKAENIQTGINDGSINVTINERAAQLFAQMDLVDVLYPIEEELVYSGVLLKDWRMGMKQKDIDVEFDLPLDRFYDNRLLGFDVRATLTLVPQSPSLLNRVVNFTDYRPEGAEPLTRMDSAIQSSLGQQLTSVQWDALRYMGISWGLVNQWELPSICGGERVPVKHPYLATRSHVFIVNETRAYAAHSFENKHQNLRDTSCGQTMLGSPKSRWLCNRSYDANGQWETKLILNSEDGHAVPEGFEEWAYGPFLSVLPKSAGPKHQLKVPVTREACGDALESDRSSDPSSLHVKYTVAFSTLSPGHLKLLEVMHPEISGPSVNSTDDDVSRAHEHWEFVGTLLGLGPEGHGRKPWLVMFCGFGEFVLEIAALLLDILYWFTRQTTTGISATSVYAKGLFKIAGIVEWAYSSSKDDLIFLFIMVLMGSLDLLPSMMGVWTFIPFELSQTVSGKRTWSIRHKMRSHRERQSERLESWKVAAATFALAYPVLLVARYFLLYLINPSHSPSSGATPQTWLASAGSTFSPAFQMTSTFMQIRHNHLASTFAGEYALAARLETAAHVLRVVSSAGTMFSWVIGHQGVWDGVSPEQALDVCLSAALTWQSLRYPRVEQQVEGEEDE